MIDEAHAPMGCVVSSRCWRELRTPGAKARAAPQLDPWHRHQLRAIADCFEDGDAVRDVLVEAAKTHPEAARLVAEFLELVTPEIIAGLRQPSPKPARRLNNGSEADD